MIFSVCIFCMIIKEITNEDITSACLKAWKLSALHSFLWYRSLYQLLYKRMLLFLPCNVFLFNWTPAHPSCQAPAAAAEGALGPLAWAWSACSGLGLEQQGGMCCSFTRLHQGREHFVLPLTQSKQPQVWSAEGTQCCTSLQLTGNPAACHQVTCKTQLLKWCTSCLTLHLLSFLTLCISFSN